MIRLHRQAVHGSPPPRACLCKRRHTAVRADALRMAARSASRSTPVLSLENPADRQARTRGTGPRSIHVPHLSPTMVCSIPWRPLTSTPFPGFCERYLLFSCGRSGAALPGDMDHPLSGAGLLGLRRTGHRLAESGSIDHDRQQLGFPLFRYDMQGVCNRLYCKRLQSRWASWACL